MFSYTKTTPKIFKSNHPTPLERTCQGLDHTDP